MPRTISNISNDASLDSITTTGSGGIVIDNAVLAIDEIIPVQNDQIASKLYVDQEISSVVTGLPPDQVGITTLNFPASASSVTSEGAQVDFFVTGTGLTLEGDDVLKKVTVDVSSLNTDINLNNAHRNASTGVHGVIGDVVGTSDAQTVTNKVIDTASNTLTIAGADITSGTLPDARISTTGVTQHVSSIDHDQLLNYIGNEHLDWTADQGAANIHDSNILSSSVTQHEASIDHDQLLNYVATEHVDWAVDQGPINISDANITSTAVTQHLPALPSGSIVGTTDANTLTNKTMGDALNMNNNKLSNLATPTLDTDGATKKYVDSVASGLDLKESVRGCTQADFDSNTTLSGTVYNNTGGASGRGQFTSTLITTDSAFFGGLEFTSANNDSRLLVKAQNLPAENGIYTVTISGTSLTLDRSTHFDQDIEVTSGAFCFVEQGNQASTGWVLVTSDPITIGGASGTSLTFSQFSAVGFDLDNFVSLDGVETLTNKTINTASNTLTIGQNQNFGNFEINNCLLLKTEGIDITAVEPYQIIKSTGATFGTTQVFQNSGSQARLYIGHKETTANGSLDTLQDDAFFLNPLPTGNLRFGIDSTVPAQISVSKVAVSMTVPLDMNSNNLTSVGDITSTGDLTISKASGASIINPKTTNVTALNAGVKCDTTTNTGEFGICQTAGNPATPLNVNDVYVHSTNGTSEIRFLHNNVDKLRIKPTELSVLANMNLFDTYNIQNCVDIDTQKINNVTLSGDVVSTTASQTITGKTINTVNNTLTIGQNQDYGGFSITNAGNITMDQAGPLIIMNNTSGTGCPLISMQDFADTKVLLGISCPSTALYSGTTSGDYCIRGKVGNSVQIGVGAGGTPSGFKVSSTNVTSNLNLDMTNKNITNVGQISYGSPNTYTTISGNNNNVNIGTSTVVRFLAGATSDFFLTGIVAASTYKQVVIINQSAYKFTIQNEHVSSTANNRFDLAANIVVKSGDAVSLLYNLAVNRWISSIPS